MANFNFVIPYKRQDLVEESDDSGVYYVRDIIGLRELTLKTKDAKRALLDDGPKFILENFNVFYSVLHHENGPLDLVYESYRILHLGVTQLQKSLGFVLEDKSFINEELQQEYQNVIKMLIYIYVQTVIQLEYQNCLVVKTQMLPGKGRKNKDQPFALDKKAILSNLNGIMQMDIVTFWNSAVVELGFVNLISEVVYKFLLNSEVKTDTDVKTEIFSLMGVLIKNYNHSSNIAVRLTQMIKDEDHLVHVLPEGIKILVETFNCKGLIHELVELVTEWQTDEKFQESQASRYCAQFLTQMAVAMPDLMLPEVLYLNKYLCHDAVALRISVLNTITEIIIQVMTGKDKMEYHEEFLNCLFEHMGDNSALVRTRVIQNWTRLQKDEAIPINMINKVLKSVIDYHLLEKSTLVRKCSANLVTTFLTHNPYSAELSQERIVAELEASVKLFETASPVIQQAKTLMLDKFQKVWMDALPEVVREIKEELQKPDENEIETGEDDVQVTETIKRYLEEKRYGLAFQLWKSHCDDFDEDNTDNDAVLEEFLKHIKALMVDSLNLADAIRDGLLLQDNFLLSIEDIKKFESLSAKIDHLKLAVEFLKCIESVIEPMTELLETTSISDMHEAVAFFKAAYQFNINKASDGITAMLRIMKRNEQDRKDMVIAAFKTIYLETDAGNMHDHCTTILNRLITFWEIVSNEDTTDLESIVIDWTKTGILDNSVISMMWDYFLKKEPVTDDQSFASLELLCICGEARKTIVTRNFKLVTSIGERGQNDMRLMGSACHFLSLVGEELIDINAENAPLRMPIKDDLFRDLYKVLLENFFKPVQHYNHVLKWATILVFKVCAVPDQFFEELVHDLMTTMSEQTEVQGFIYIRVCQLLGIIALRVLDYFDNTVYRELKRREMFQENKTKKPKPTRTNKRKSAASDISMNKTNQNGNDLEESTLQGAEADDEDAEFILGALERFVVTGRGLLAKLAPLILNVCENPDIYNDEMLQLSAVTALIRYMLVSSDFCSQHIRLLFTILQKTLFVQIKVNILLHLSDLFIRMPNIIEPWTSKIYALLKDDSVAVRRATYCTLCGLILSDMIRAHSTIHLMVGSLKDPDEELNSMGRMFFNTLSKKENNLYHVLPDIFSHIMDCQEYTNEDCKDIMKFLFELMDKGKHMENLVDRFCFKLTTTNDLRHHRNIAHCLTLITYNEKAMRKLHENFHKYKHLVHDPEIYTSLKTVLQNNSKQQVGKVDLKPIIEEIESAISSVFETSHDVSRMKPPKAKKTTKKSKIRKKQTKRRASTDSESD